MTHCTSAVIRGNLDSIQRLSEEILDEVEDLRAYLDELEGKTGEDSLCPYGEKLCKTAEKMFKSE